MLRLWRDSLAVRITTYILLGLLLVLVAPWVYLDWQTARDLDAELQRLREAGAPLSLAEAAPDPVPPSENAAELYQQVLGRMQDGQMQNPSVFELSGHDTLIERDYLAGNAPHQSARAALEDPMIEQAFQTLRQATERDRCVWSVNWEDGPGALFPHYSRMRSAARWLSAKSKLRAQAGDIDEALDWTLVSLRMSEHAGNDPSLIAQLVAIAIQAIASAQAEETLNAGAPSPEVAREMIDYLRSVDMRKPFRNALVGERAMGIYCFDLVREGNPRELIGNLSGSSGPDVYEIFSWLYGSPLGRPMLRNDEIIYIQSMSKEIEILDAAAPAQRERLLTEEQERIPPIAVVSHILFPVFSRSAQKRDEATSRLDLFEIALAAELFHAENGEWPFDLRQLQDTLDYDLPQDPFAQAPYRYRREKQGFVVYGVGRDFDDDGGRAMSEPGYDYENHDIVWRVKR